MTTNTEPLEDKNNIQANAIHEIRRINRELKYRSEILRSNLELYSGVGQNIKNDITDIFALSSLISTRLNFFDYEINPSMPLQNKKYIKIYQKFDKIRYCLNSLFREKNIAIMFRDQCYEEIFVYDVFDLLPFVIFKNCYKYSPPSCEVNVYFKKESNILITNIESLGPMLLASEKEKILNSIFRGVNAQAVSSGTGSGLVFAKKICELNSIEISISQDRVAEVINGIEYGLFSVELQIPINNSP